MAKKTPAQRLDVRLMWEMLDTSLTRLTLNTDSRPKTDKNHDIKISVTKRLDQKTRGRRCRHALLNPPPPRRGDNGVSRFCNLGSSLDCPMVPACRFFIERKALELRKCFFPSLLSSLFLDILYPILDPKTFPKGSPNELKSQPKPPQKHGSLLCL